MSPDPDPDPESELWLPGNAEATSRALAATQHGVVTRSQLRAAGVPRSRIRHLVDSGRWSCLSDEVLRVEGSAPTDAQALMAATLDAGPGAVLSAFSAGAWWGSIGLPLRPIHVLRAWHSRRPSSLATVHTVRRLPERWVTTYLGVPIVRPELLAMQLFDLCRAGRAERLCERMWSDGLLSGPTIAELLDDLGARGRNGVAGLRAYFEPRGIGYVPPASGLEARLAQILRDAGLEFRRQVDSGGRRWTGRVDFRHVTLPVILEAQSRRHHAAQVDVAADAIRIEQLRADGFEVVELSDTLIWSDPAEVVRRVRAAIDVAVHR